jgi:hypothetical protein
MSNIYTFCKINTLFKATVGELNFMNGLWGCNFELNLVAMFWFDYQMLPTWRQQLVYCQIFTYAIKLKQMFEGNGSYIKFHKWALAVELWIKLRIKFSGWTTKCHKTQSLILPNAYIFCWIQAMVFNNCKCIKFHEWPLVVQLWTKLGIIFLFWPLDVTNIVCCQIFTDAVKLNKLFSTTANTLNFTNFLLWCNYELSIKSIF